VIAVNVLYPNKPGTEFDIAYYLDHHIPLVRRLFGSSLKGVKVQRFVSGSQTGSPASFVVICDLLFESAAAYQGSVASALPELIQDVPRYTNSEPLIQIADVLL